MDRALVWSAAGLATGIAAAAAGIWVFLSILLLLALSASASFHARWPLRQHLVWMLFFLSVGSAMYQLRVHETRGDALSSFSRTRPAESLYLEGVVRQAPLLLPETDYAKFVLDVDRVQHAGTWLPLSGRVLVRWTEPSAQVHSGERVRLSGVLGHRLGPVNHGLQGIEDFYRKQGIHSEIRIRKDAVEKVATPRFSLIYLGSRLRAAEADILRRAVPPSVLRFVLTIWLGERGLITPEENEVYINSGTAHILSVSGIHLGIVFLSAQFLLRTVIRDRSRRAAVIMLLVLAFTLASGARVATLRCAIMVWLYLSAELLRREPDPPTALSLAAIILLLVNPNDLFSGGFLLSFASVASLMLFTPALEELFERAPRWLGRVLATSVSAQALPLPFALHTFHVLPLLGPVANLIVIPLLSVVLWLIFLTVLVGGISSSLAMLSGHALAPFIWLAVYVCRLAASVPGGHPVLTSPTWFAIAGYYLCAAALLLFCHAHARRSITGGLAAIGLLLMVACWHSWRPEPRVDFLDVGHGDSAFLRTPEGATMLVDAGDASEFSDLGAQVVVPFLLSNGVERLNTLVITHPDRDHIGGAFAVLRHVSVGEVLLGTSNDSELERDLRRSCKALNVPVRRVFRGGDVPLAGAAVEVLHPGKAWRPDLKENEHSLVLRVRWPGVDILLAGDIERGAEAYLAGTDCAATVLKVPHHGSDTSSTTAFIDAVHPSIAVISVVPRGNFRTANPAVIARYETAGASVFRTDLYGGIKLTTRDNTLVLESARKSRGLPVP